MLLDDDELEAVSGGTPEIVVTGGDDEDYLVDDVSVFKPFLKDQ